MTSYPMPIPETVANVMTDLLGKDVAVQAGKPLALRPKAPLAISVFRDDQGFPATVIICDLALAAHTGAALAMVPAEQGLQVMRTGKLPDSLYDNFKEVVNIVGGTLFNEEDTPHLVLRDVHVSPNKLAAELKPLFSEPVSGLFLDVTIEDYGTGKMTMLAVEIPE
jgi:hypothetical protein